MVQAKIETGKYWKMLEDKTRENRFLFIIHFSLHFRMEEGNFGKSTNNWCKNSAYQLSRFNCNFDITIHS